MSGFNNFLTGLQQGRQAKQGRELFEQQKQLNDFQLTQAQETAEAKRGFNDLIGGYTEEGDFAGAATAAAGAGNKEVYDMFIGLDERQREMALKTANDRATIAATIMQLPQEQQAGAIQAYGEEYGFNPEQIAQAQAAPDIVLPMMVNAPREIEAVLKQMTPEARTEGDSIVSVQTDPFKGVTTEEVYTRDPSFSEQTARQNADTSRIRAENPQPNVVVNTGNVAEGQRPIVDKPPKGFQRVWDAEAGSYRDEPIPGSDTAEERGSRQAKATSALEAARSRTRLISETIDQAIQQTQGNNTGPILGRNPLATNVQATLDTVRANIGFNELNEMKQNSPTGGALGQVTEKEIAFLQSVLGSLERTQDEEQLDANLARAKQEIQASFARIEAAYQQDLEAGLFEAQQTRGPAPQSAQSTADDPLGLR